MPRCGLGEDIGVLEGCPRGAAPGHGLLLEQFGEERDLLLEQHVVVVQVVAEEGERFREGATPEDDLGPAIRECVHGRKPLEHADWIVGAQHSYTGSEMDTVGTRSDASQHSLRGRD